MPLIFKLQGYLIRLNFSAAYCRHVTQWLQCAQKALLYIHYYEKKQTIHHCILYESWLWFTAYHSYYCVKKVNAKDISYQEYFHWQRSSVPSYYSCIDLPHEEHSLHSYSVICHQCISAVVSHKRGWLERMLPLGTIMHMTLPTQHFAI